ncbi:hypothetical protein HYW75_03725 [Candidatus Pacearchaeota archaeon]|nr:hypothetical protein [Candidatus Pacearchaeota archaeon]
MNYIGMDIHKQFTVAVVKDDQGNKLAENKFTNCENNFGIFMPQYKPEETKSVIESTCVWEYIYKILEAKKYNVKLANPSRTIPLSNLIGQGLLKYREDENTHLKKKLEELRKEEEEHPEKTLVNSIKEGIKVLMGSRK